MFKCLQRLPFLEENTYLRKTINEEIKIAISRCIANLKYIVDSYRLSNVMKNNLKVVEGNMSTKDYKNEHFFPKRAKDYFIQENVFTYASEEMNNFTQTKDLYTAQKMKFSVKDFFSKCDQIRSLSEP